MPRLAVRGLSARCVLGYIIDCHSEQLVLNSLGLKVPVSVWIVSLGISRKSLQRRAGVVGVLLCACDVSTF